MEKIGCDVWKIIFNYLDLKSQIYLISTCHFFRKNLFITDLMNADVKLLKKLNTSVLRYSIFSGVVSLNAESNKNIIDVTFMTTLQELDASNDCGIGQQGIQGLYLTKLKTNDNPKITNIASMTTLRELDAGWKCGINQQGIQGLQLVKLDAKGNSKIIDVAFMTTLWELDVSHTCGSANKGLKGSN